MFEETGSNSWNGIRVRRGEQYGTIIRDINGFVYRVLTIKTDDGETYSIKLYNVAGRKEPKENRDWEWYWDKNADKQWYRFR